MAASAPLWPWLAVAASGALHGLNPLAGWGILAWRGRRGDQPLLRALAPIAIGNMLSVVMVAAAVPLALQWGREFSPLLLQGLAALLLAVAVLRQRPAHGTGLGLWSFIVATAHGASWMLVPALVPLCASGMPGREIALSGSLLLLLAAILLHLAAMLVTTALAGGLALRLTRLAGSRDQR